VQKERVRGVFSTNTQVFSKSLASLVDTVKSNRQGLHQNPTEQFTIKREEHRMIEDIKLITHFAPWLQDLTGKKVSADTICEDLQDGEALCHVMSLVKGSGVSTYHKVGGKFDKLDSFKGMENLTQFQDACKRLALPVTVSREELVAGNLGKLASCLVFVAHTCASQGVGVKQMDQTLRDRLDSVTGATEDVIGGAQGDQQTWWQALLGKFGLSDYFQSFNVEQLKAYAAKVRENAQAKVEEMKAKLPEAVQQKLG
jgi:hypothetical protein